MALWAMKYAVSIVESVLYIYNWLGNNLSVTRLQTLYWN